MEPPPVPNEATLRDAALAYLGRFAATEAGLLRVLDRRIDRWLRAAPDPEMARPAADAARQAARTVVRRLAEAGVLDDAAYAQAKARGLRRAGVSRRVATSRLVAKGVPTDEARGALPDDPDTELDAALVLTRKRRIGPFRTRAPDRPRELAILARAGFPRDIAVRALDMPTEDAESRITMFRQ